MTCALWPSTPLSPHPTPSPAAQRGMARKSRRGMTEAVGVGRELRHLRNLRETWLCKWCWRRSVQSPKLRTQAASGLCGLVRLAAAKGRSAGVRALRMRYDRAQTTLRLLRRSIMTTPLLDRMARAARIAADV